MTILSVCLSSVSVFPNKPFEINPRLVTLPFRSQRAIQPLNHASTLEFEAHNLHSKRCVLRVKESTLAIRTLTDRGQGTTSKSLSLVRYFFFFFLASFHERYKVGLLTF